MIVIADKRAERDRILYNLRPGDRELMREFQNDCDPITGDRLSVNAHCDHDHRNGLIRGLLNPMTNKFLIDKLDILRASIAYLENPPAIEALGGPVYGLIGKAQMKKKMLYGPRGELIPQPRG